jgi:hypothetical protein
MTRSRPITFLASAAITPVAALAVAACGGRGVATGVTFGLYMPALDVAEEAAEIYAGLVRRADKLPWSEDPPAEPLGGSARGGGWHDSWPARWPRQTAC